MNLEELNTTTRNYGSMDYINTDNVNLVLLDKIKKKPKEKPVRRYITPKKLREIFADVDNGVDGYTGFMYFADHVGNTISNMPLAHPFLKALTREINIYISEYIKNKK